MHVDGPWLVCLEEAWVAYCEGSSPIGAAFVDVAGTVRWRGRNRIDEPAAPPPWLHHTRLAHAEMNVMVQLRPQDHPRLRTGTLYTTLEPCPMCFGAAVMTGIRRIRYAARDGWAGAGGLVAASPYIASKEMVVQGPEPEIEAIALVLATDQLVRRNSPRMRDVLAAFLASRPDAVEVGLAFRRSGRLQEAARRKAPISEILAIVQQALDLGSEGHCAR